MWAPSASTQGAAINQWPVTTMRIDAALRKSTQRLRFAGVCSARRVAAVHRDVMPTAAYRYPGSAGYSYRSRLHGLTPAAPSPPTCKNSIDPTPASFADSGTGCRGWILLRAGDRAGPVVRPAAGGPGVHPFAASGPDAPSGRVRRVHRRWWRAAAWTVRLRRQTGLRQALELGHLAERGGRARGTVSATVAPRLGPGLTVSGLRSRELLLISRANSIGRCNGFRE